MYEIISDGIRKLVLKKTDNGSIPIDHGNMDFQEFLKWNSEQESPLDWESKPECPGLEQELSEND